MKMRFYYLLLLANSLSNFVLFFPHILLVNATNGLPFALITGFFIACINAYLLLSVFNKYKNKDLIDINRKLFGKKLGNAATIIRVILNLFIAGFFFIGIAKGAQLYLMTYSPMWYTASFLGLAIWIVAKQDIRNFLYCKGFFSSILAFATVLMFFIVGKNISWSYIRGTLIHSIKLPKLIMISPAAFFFTGIHHLSIFNPCFARKISIKKTLSFFMFILLPFALIFLCMPLGTWGPYAIKNLHFMEAITADTVGIDLFFIERFLYIAAPALVTLGVINIDNYTYVAFNLIKKLGISEKLYKLFILGVILIYIILASLDGPIDNIVHFAGIFGVIWLFTHMSLNLLAFIFSKLKGGKRHEKN